MPRATLGYADHLVIQIATEVSCLLVRVSQSYSHFPCSNSASVVQTSNSSNASNYSLQCSMEEEGEKFLSFLPICEVAANDVTNHFLCSTLRLFTFLEHLFLPDVSIWLAAGPEFQHRCVRLWMYMYYVCCTIHKAAHIHHIPSCGGEAFHKIHGWSTLTMPYLMRMYFISSISTQPQLTL